MVSYKKYITREYVRANPDLVFLFGDNVASYGRAGQAKEMRSEPNCYGIPTKWFPSREESAYFTDIKFEKIKIYIDDAFAAVPKDKHIVISSGGIGTGLAELPKRAPKVLAYILKKIEELNV